MIYKKLLTCLFVLLTSAAIGQEYETKNFDLPKETKQAVLNDKEKKEPSVILSDKSTYEYLYNKDGDLTSYYTKYRKIRINDAADVEQFNRIYFPVSEAGDLLALRLRTVTKDGKVKEMNKSHLKKITEDENDYLILAVEGLEKDSEMEYFFTIKRGVTYFITEYAQMGVYVSRSETTIISPENLLWDARSYNGTMSRTDTVISEKRYLTMSAEATPVLDSEEKYASYNANRLRIEFKLAKNLSNNMKLFSFADAGKRYFEMMHSEEKSAKKDIEKLASSLGLKKLDSDEARIMALENHMKTTVNINEQESDPSIGAMLKKHYGPENQVVSLYILMFEYLNIPAELVVTTSRFDAVFDPGFETWNFLDSYLIYFPSSGKYLDPTNFLYRYGMFPFEFMGNSGLFIKRVTLGDVATSTTTVRKIDGPDSKASFDNMTAIISFSKDIKNAEIQYKREFNGHADGLLRAAYFYSDEEARTKMIDDLMKSTFKDVKVTDAKVLNYDLSKDDYTKPMILEARVSSPSLIENAGSNIIFSVGDVIGQQVEMYQDHARQNPIDANYPHRYDRLIVVNVPQGYDVKGLEKLNMNIVYDDKGIGFTSSYERNGNVVTITVQEYYNQYQLPVSAFEDFKKVINAAADFNKIKLVFSKTP